MTMGNYKYMEEVIDGYVRKKKPFIILKYSITSFNNQTNNVYEIATLGKKKLQYVLLDRVIARRMIEKYDLPVLWKVSSRGIIWGDKTFKAKFKEKGLVW